MQIFKWSRFFYRSNNVNTDLVFKTNLFNELVLREGEVLLLIWFYLVYICKMNKLIKTDFFLFFNVVDKIVMRWFMLLVCGRRKLMKEFRILIETEKSWCFCQLKKIKDVDVIILPIIIIIKFSWFIKCFDHTLHTITKNGVNNTWKLSVLWFKFYDNNHISSRRNRKDMKF